MIHNYYPLIDLCTQYLKILLEVVPLTIRVVPLITFRLPGLWQVVGGFNGGSGRTIVGEHERVDKTADMSIQELTASAS
jgi:hypothetical protein